MATTRRAQQLQETRAAVASRHAAMAEGGRDRWTVDPAEALATRQRAAAAVNGPVGLARRLAKQWPDLGEDERAEVRAVLVLLDGIGPC